MGGLAIYMSSKVYLRILQAGIILSLFIVFFVFAGLLFPFITSKQLSFNILMEAMLAVWLVLIMRYPEYRPKKSYITGGLVAYFIAILASIAVSYDPALSFWGDAERMLGLFHLLHFLIFYFILITVFRSWAEWRWLFMVSVAVATVISLIGINGEMVYSRIGNTAYVSGYLIFNLFFTAILFIRTKSRTWRWLYLLPVVIMLWEFALARTSGAIIGLGLSLLAFFLLLGLLHENHSRRRMSLAVFLLAVLGVIIIFSQSGSAWFQNSFLKSLTFQKATFQTRLISWQGAAIEFSNHWLFGAGFGNYAVIFDKQFDPKFYNYARVETYFDRAHNNLVDIASTTGIVGLLTYLSIFAAVAYYLIVRYRSLNNEEGAARLEILILVALILAYFIQNLAVFDSYVTYIGLMMTLGYIFWFVNQAETVSGEDELLLTEGPQPRLVVSSRAEIATLMFFLLLAFLAINQFNLKPWRMFRGVIDGYTLLASGKLSSAVVKYQEALIGTPLDRDGRSTLVNWVAASPGLLQEMDPNQVESILQYVIELARLNVSHNEYDSMAQMQLAQILDVAARQNYQDLALFNYYSGQAIQAIDFAIESSPRRPPVYLIKAQMLLSRGEKEAAIETVQYAINLNRDYPEGYCSLAQFYFFLEAADEEKTGDYLSQVQEPLDKCVDLGGVADIYNPSLLTQALSYYAPKGDQTRSLILAERLVRLDNGNATAWLNLAKLYRASGYEELAFRAYRQAVSLDQTIAQDWQDYLNSLED